MFILAAGAIAACGGADDVAPTADSEPEPVTEQQTEQSGVVVGMVGSPIFSAAEGQYVVEEVCMQRPGRASSDGVPGTEDWA